MTFENNKWRVRITVNNKLLSLGIFDNEEDAAKVRDQATIKYYGDNGKLNFPIADESF